MFEFILIFLPITFGFLSSYLCNVQKNSGSTVKFRPPPIVFSIAWTILYILIGLSSFFCFKNSKKVSKPLIIFFYLLLNISLSSWVYFYSCKNQKIIGIYTLIISIICALFCYTIGDTISQLLMIPLIGWLIFATLLNVYEV